MTTTLPGDRMPPLNRDFVAHFGEMGSRWGLNRNVAQIFALLFIATRALNADEIAQSLDSSRSNVSSGLKELQSWRLVKLKHLPGDRHEYFEAPTDLWEIFRVVAVERRRREIDPMLFMLRMALRRQPACETEAHAQDRMRQMYDLVEQLVAWFDAVQELTPETAVKLMEPGADVSRILEPGNREGARV
jgi:DNA-binding transcriptional regulator GbsR (MarR family)